MAGEGIGSAATVEVGRWSDLPVRPWRNGAGAVRELARGSHGPRGPGWRVSIADITSDGPFSRFDGCDRVLTLVTGDRLTLEVDGAANLLQPGRPFRFDGAAAVRAELPEGPVQALNLITDRKAACEGEVSVAHPAAGRVETAAGETVVLVNIGLADVEVPLGARPTRLGRFDWLVVAGERAIVLPGTGTLALVRVRARTAGAS